MDQQVWHDVEGHPNARYRRVNWPEDAELVRTLFSGYRRWLSDHRDPAQAAASRVDAGLSVVDDLIERLPGSYGLPDGDVLLWFENDEVVACGALRRLESTVGEIKRVHVRSDYRGGEFGPPFVRALIGRARDLGYATLRADALGSMAGAIDFYEQLGFRRIPPYWPHPAEGTVFFECDIGAASRAPDRGPGSRTSGRRRATGR